MKKLDHMEYMDGMERLESDIMTRVIDQMEAYDYDSFTANDVKAALAKDTLSPRDFQALLSPVAQDFLEEIAQRAQRETRAHFGNSIYMFTPLYIANYCENHCIYCGFNSHNKIKRSRLNFD